MKAFKKTFAVSTAVSALLLAAPIAAQAVEVSTNVTLATDYTVRGWSQTDEKPAIQGGFDVEFDSGFYVGTWASSVNFGDESNTSTELDYYIGWSGEIGADVTLDINGTYFTYPGDSSADYQEYAVSLTWMDATLGLVYSPKYLGDGGPDFYYPYLSYDLALPEGFGLNFHVGYSRTNDSDFFDDGEKSYLDWSIGLTKEIKGVELGLTYVDTDLSGIDDADARVIFSLSKSF